MLPKIGPVELLLILVIVTMLFGVGKLPEVFGAVGRGIREFRRASSDDDKPQVTTTETIAETTVVETPAATVTPVETTTVTHDGVKPQTEA